MKNNLARHALKIETQHTLVDYGVPKSKRKSLNGRIGGLSKRGKQCDCKDKSCPKCADDKKDCACK